MVFYSNLSVFYYVIVFKLCLWIGKCEGITNKQGAGLFIRGKRPWMYLVMAQQGIIEGF